MAPLLPPEKVTLPWLTAHVPVQLWGSAIVLLASTFLLGVRASEIPFFRYITALKTIDGAKPTEKPLALSEASIVVPEGARVILHVHSNSSMSVAEGVNARLSSMGYAVAPIRRVDRARAPSIATQVRFFHEADQVGAEQLVKVLNAWGVRDVERQYFPWFTGKVPRSQFEIWFVPR